MADELLNKIGHAFNVATQHVSREVIKGSTKPANESLQHVSDTIIDALAEGNEARHYHTDLDKGTKGDILRPVALGYKAGAIAAHAYEQGAKYLFGRGQRHQSFAGNSTDKERQFGPEGYQERAHFEHGGDPLEDVGAESQRRAARYKNNLRALKQDGVLGLAVKGLAAGVGNLVGAAFCGNDAKAEAWSKNIAEGAHTFNAMARTALLNIPMIGVVLTGVLVGVTLGAAVAAWKGAKALHARSKPKTDAPQTSHAAAEDDDKVAARANSAASLYEDARSSFDEDEAMDPPQAGDVPEAKTSEAGAAHAPAAAAAAPHDADESIEEFDVNPPRAADDSVPPVAVPLERAQSAPRAAHAPTFQDEGRAAPTLQRAHSAPPAAIHDAAGPGSKTPSQAESPRHAAAPADADDASGA